MHFILDDIGAGLLDHQIMDKRGIRARTYYRYKEALGKKCAALQSKISEEDRALATYLLENRYSKYLLEIERRMRDNNCSPDFFEVAAELARALYTIKAGDGIRH